MKFGHSFTKNVRGFTKATRTKSGYVAIDADTKLIPAFYVGKRFRPDTAAFLWDLYHRLADRVELTTDGLNHYTVSVPECFGTDVDFAQLVKLFGDVENPSARYSPPREWRSLYGPASLGETPLRKPEKFVATFALQSSRGNLF